MISAEIITNDKKQKNRKSNSILCPIFRPSTFVKLGGVVRGRKTEHKILWRCMQTDESVVEKDVKKLIVSYIIDD